MRTQARRPGVDRQHFTHRRDDRNVWCYGAARGVDRQHFSHHPNGVDCQHFSHYPIDLGWQIVVLGFGNLT